MKRLLSLSTNTTGLSAAAAAIYAAVVMIWHATHHAGVIDPQVIVAALGAAAFLYARLTVTPIADPRNATGQPLVPDYTPAAAPAAPSNVTIQPPAQGHVAP